MICEFCSEEYDSNKFDVCPYCLTQSIKCMNDSQTNNLVTECSSEVVLIDNQSHYDSNKSIEVPKEKVLVSDVFQGHKYYMFIDYCDRNGLKYFEDLSAVDFNSLSNEKGIGPGKVKAYYKRYEELRNDDSLLVKINASDSNIFENINSQSRRYKLTSLYAIGVSNRVINKLEKAGFKRVSELENISEKELKNIISSRDLETLIKASRYLEKNTIDLIKEVLEESKDESEYDIFLMRALGYTLQAIAAGEDVTRERIRQKEKKFYKKISEYIYALQDMLLGTKNYIEVDALTNLFEHEEYNLVLNHFCKMDEKFEYLDFADVFVSKTIGISIENRIVEVMSDYIGEGINLSNNREELESLFEDMGYDFMKIGQITNLLRKMGFRIYNDYAIRAKVSYGLLCERIIRDQFPNGIKLSQNDEKVSADLDMLRELVKKTYGELKLSTSNRALSARISDYLIQRDRGIAISPCNVEVDMSIILEIKEYIENYDENKVYFAEIFAKYEGLLRVTSNIDNHYFLHGVLKYYYPDDYYYDRDYILKDKNNKDNEGSVINRIRRYILELGGPITKKQIKDRIDGITDAVIFNAIATDAELFQWEHRSYTYSKILEFEECEIEILKMAIESLLNKHSGYCSEELFFDYVEKKIPETLIKNGISSPVNLFYVASYFFDGLFDFRRPHIASKGRFKHFKMKEIILELLGHPKKLLYSEYTGLSKSMKWSNVTTGILFSDIESNYIRVSDNEYIRDDYFDINDTELLQIEELLLQNMPKGFLSIMDFSDWEMLPQADGEWNEFRLGSIIEKYGNQLEVVYPEVVDRRYQKGVIVDKKSNFKSFSEIVAYALRKCNMNDIPENEMYSFLVINGLAKQVIPRELYNSEHVMFVKEKFEIKRLV